MIQPSLELVKAIQRDYEREAEQIYLRKLARGSRPQSRFMGKLERLGKDMAYLAIRLLARKHKPA